MKHQRPVVEVIEPAAVFLVTPRSQERQKVIVIPKNPSENTVKCHKENNEHQYQDNEALQGYDKEPCMSIIIKDYP